MSATPQPPAEYTAWWCTEWSFLTSLAGIVTMVLAASGSVTLHQLGRRALTHDEVWAESAVLMLMARSGHTSVRSLAKYARVSAEALARHQAERDPARRR